MGEGFLNFYKLKIKKEYKIAFFVTLFAALAIHLYKFTNYLPNEDSVFNCFSDQNNTNFDALPVLGSGRWALSPICNLTSRYDLPWLIGLWSSFFIALTNVVIVAIFKMKNPIVISLTGGLIASSLAVTETFFYLFTADGYMVAMFLAALSVYFSRLEEKRFSRHFLSGICICVSCGIYQSYVSFSLILALCYFIYFLFEQKNNKNEYFRWILRQIIIYTVSIVFYYVIWKLCLRFSAIPENDYQGISKLGFSLDIILSGIIASLKNTKMYFWGVEGKVSLYGVLNIISLLSLISVVIVALIKSKVYKSKSSILLLVLSFGAIIPFANIWQFASYYVEYKPRMLPGFPLLFVLAVVLIERWSGICIKNCACIFFIVMIVNNAALANISYFYMHFTYERTYARAAEIAFEIHDLQDEYEFDNLVMIGLYDEDRFWNKEIGDDKILSNESLSVITSHLRKEILFGPGSLLSFLQTNFDIYIDAADEGTKEKLMGMDCVDSMPCWPNKGSMTVVDNTLVIKFSDEVKE